MDATWHARPCGRARRAHVGACVARRWHECGMDANANAWVVPRGMNSSRLEGDGPTGIVGPGLSIGAVTQ